MSELSPDFFNRPLAEVDPEIADVLRLELDRQQRTLEMIASENFVPQAVLDCQGTVLTNKYAEGYPGKRYYGGCEHVDVAEQLAIDRAKALFGAEHANVQPHAGRAGQRRRLPRAAAARRHDHGPRAAARRPPDARHEAQRLRAACTTSRPTRCDREDLADRHGRGRAARPRAQAEADPRRLVGLPAPARLRRASARSPTRSARCSWSTWPTSRASSPPACTPTRCRTPTSSRPRSTRRSAARAAA